MPWLDAMLDYLRGNAERFASAINHATSKIKVLPSDFLY
jgi:cysteine-S-conjugate beta-lyase